MIVFRALSLLCVLAAAAALAFDLYRSVQSSQLVSTALGKLWFDLHTASLNQAQAVIERYVWPKLWDPALVTLLQWPAWLVFILFAVVFLAVARLFTRKRAD